MANSSSTLDDIIVFFVADYQSVPLKLDANDVKSFSDVKKILGKQNDEKQITVTRDKPDLSFEFREAIGIIELKIPKELLNVDKVSKDQIEPQHIISVLVKNKNDQKKYLNPIPNRLAAEKKAAEQKIKADKALVEKVAKEKKQILDWEIKEATLERSVNARAFDLYYKINDIDPKKRTSDQKDALNVLRRGGPAHNWARATQADWKMIRKYEISLEALEQSLRNMEEKSGFPANKNISEIKYKKVKYNSQTMEEWLNNIFEERDKEDLKSFVKKQFEEYKNNVAERLKNENLPMKDYKNFFEALEKSQQQSDIPLKVATRIFMEVSKENFIPLDNKDAFTEALKNIPEAWFRIKEFPHREPIVVLPPGVNTLFGKNRPRPDDPKTDVGVKEEAKRASPKPNESG